MPLPILHTTQEPTREDLIRLFHRTELHWTRHLAEETTLDVGSAFANPKLNRVHAANRVLDALLPEDLSPEQAVAQVNDHFRAAGSRCRSWVMNPSAPPARNALLEQYLTACGHERFITPIYHLAGRPRTSIHEVAGLKIIPARASYRHARALAEEQSRRWSEPQLADAAMLHLEDAHTDALLALKDTAAAAWVCVLAVGDIGSIADLFVSESFRRRGIGRTMLSRALEICARSLFRHVFLSVLPGNIPAITLYESVGFRQIGEIVTFTTGR